MARLTFTYHEILDACLETHNTFHTRDIQHSRAVCFYQQPDT